MAVPTYTSVVNPTNMIEKALAKTTNLTCKEFIEKAIEGGYEPFKTVKIAETTEHEIFGEEFSVFISGPKGGARKNIHKILLDPKAWAACGKSCGWDNNRSERGAIMGKFGLKPEFVWRGYMHQFTDTLIELTDKT